MPRSDDERKRDADGLSLDAGSLVSLYLLVRFRRHDASEAGVGVLRSYSTEEVCFLTREQLEPGESLGISICTANRRQSTCTTMTAARVVETKLDRDDIYLVRAAILADELGCDDVDVVNRREHPRRRLGIRGVLRRANQKQFHPCRLLDISNSGLRFRSLTQPRSNERLFVQSRGKSEGPLRRMLSADVMVMWTKHIGGGEYEVGGRFLTVALRDTDDDESVEPPEAGEP